MMVETLESPQQIVIPAGTTSNSILTLERKGAHKLGNKSYRGNHYVHLQVSCLWLGFRKVFSHKTELYEF